MSQEPLWRLLGKYTQAPTVAVPPRGIVGRPKGYGQRCKHKDQYDYGKGVFVCADCGHVTREEI